MAGNAAEFIWDGSFLTEAPGPIPIIPGEGGPVVYGRDYTTESTAPPPSNVVNGGTTWKAFLRERGFAFTFDRLETRARESPTVIRNGRTWISDTHDENEFIYTNLITGLRVVRPVFDFWYYMPDQQ
jgi:hypothetical protein